MEILAAIVGALVATILTLIGSFIYDDYRKRVVIHDDYQACLRGLIAESKHVIGVIDELTPLYKQGNGIVTKRLNFDYFASARFSCTTHPRSSKLFPTLTVAYRDTLHTTDMMTRCEELQRNNVPVLGLTNTIIVSLGGAKVSIQDLLKVAEEHHGYGANPRHSPRLISKNCCTICDPCDH